MEPEKFCDSCYYRHICCQGIVDYEVCMTYVSEDVFGPMDPAVYQPSER